MKLLDHICTVAWAIRPEALEVIVGLADRQEMPEEMVRGAMHHVRGGADEITVVVEGQAIDLQPNLVTHAVSAQPGTPIDGARYAYRRGSVAVVPVIGPIVRYGSLFSSMSGGATSVSAIGLDFNLALADPAVRAIVLHVDSPGGETNGIAELASMIFDARGTKPIVAYVSDLGASAGYWLASSAGEIVVAETAALGSIGVVAAVRDPDKHDTGEIEFVSSVSPNKRIDVRTKSGRAQIQTLVDSIADVFVAGVARNRGTDAETVINDYGRGGLLVGQDAVAAGLADQIGSFEGTIRRLADAQMSTAGLSDRAPSQATRRVPGLTGNPRPAAAVIPPAAAPTTADTAVVGTTAVPDRRPLMGMRDRFFAWLDSVDGPDGSADLEASIVSEHLPQATPPPAPPPASATPVTPTPTPSPQANDDALRIRLAALEAENQSLRLRGINEKATRYATDIMREGKALPAEEAAIVALYTRAALDDMYQPISEGPSRVALVQSSYGVRMARRDLLAELAEPATLQALADRARAPQRTPDGEKMSPEREAELLGMTPLGHQVLASRNGTNGQGAH